MQIRIRHLASDIGRKRGSGLVCTILALLLVVQTKHDVMRGVLHSGACLQSCKHNRSETRHDGMSQLAKGLVCCILQAQQ